MKYIKTYEETYERKFKPGDIVKYKYSYSQPFEIEDWSSSMRSYKVRDLTDNRISYFNSHLIDIYPPDKLEEFYLKKDAEKYNL